MAERLVNVDRQTPMLLPPDLREWVAQNELAHLVLEAVELCDLSGARLNVRGSGSEQYPPSMMLALLIYCYATGLFSSRRIERATFDSVTVRYLCANHHPDHDTIASFRRSNGELFRRSFAQVLLLAREAGVLRLGVVSIDGTAMGGAGSGRAVRRLEEIERELEGLGGELLKEAERADGSDPDAGGTQLPSALSSGEQRRKKLLAAKAALEARRKESEMKKGAGKTPPPTASVSEAESQRLRRGRTPAVQGYNAQVAVDAGQSGLIVGAHLSMTPTDANQLEPGLEAIVPEAGQPPVLLLDKGYDQTEPIARVESQGALLVLCPPRRQPRARLHNEKRRGRAQWKWERRRQMEQRFLSPLVRALYRRRQASAEGAFARIKTHLGFRRFHLWGRQGASAEWMLVCLAHNCRILAARLSST
jgi:transposase